MPTFSTQPLVGSDTERHLHELWEATRKRYAWRSPPAWGEVWTIPHYGPQPTKLEVDIMEAIILYAGDLGHPVVEMPIRNRRKLLGQAHPDGRILLNPEMDPVDQPMVLLHELAHQLAGHCLPKYGQKEVGIATMKREQELIVEAVAYCVMANLGHRSLHSASRYIAMYYTRTGLVDIAIERQWDTIVRMANQITKGVRKCLPQSHPEYWENRRVS